MSFVRRYWTQVHNWVGVLITPPLTVIFISGIALFFHDALYQWEFARTPTLTLAQAMDSTAERLEQQGVLKAGGSLSFYPAEEGGFPLMYSGGGRYQAVLADGSIVKDMINGNNVRALLEVHDSLSLPMGLYLAGVIAVLMLVVTINGIVVHWPGLKKQFLQYRVDSHKDRWLDLHKLVGIASLPYLLMYAITGAAFCLLVVYQGALLVGPYHGDRNALLNDIGYPQPPAASGEPAKQLPPSILLQQSEVLLGVAPYRLTIGPWRDAAQVVIAGGSSGRDVVEDKEVTFEPGAQTPLRETQQQNMDASRLVYGAFISLHFGHFGGMTIIWLFSFLGIACLAMLFAGALRGHRRLKPSGWLYQYNRRGLVLAGSLPLATLILLLAGRYWPMDSAVRSWIFPWLFWFVTLAPLLWPMAKGAGRMRVVRLWWASGLAALVSAGAILIHPADGLTSWLAALVVSAVAMIACAVVLARRTKRLASSH